MRQLIPRRFPINALWRGALGVLVAASCGSADFAQPNPPPRDPTAPTALGSSPAEKPQPPSPTPADPHDPSHPGGPDPVALAEDGAARLTIPVMIDGKGPFQFIIDTGADRTVISRELADRLALPEGPHVLVQNSGGVDDETTAVITHLTVGGRVTGRIEAPKLAASDLGAEGMLGIDSLKDQHVVLNFKTRQLLSEASRSEAFDPNTIVVRGRSRFGQLILVDARIRGHKVFVIVDSGAQTTVGNAALQRLLQVGEPPELSRQVQIVSVTGRKTTGDYQDVPEVRIGGLVINHIPLAFAHLHTFDKFGLIEQPALLLGMDVLSQCERVTVDFKRREATFTLN